METTRELFLTGCIRCSKDSLIPIDIIFNLIGAAFQYNILGAVMVMKVVAGGGEDEASGQVVVGGLAREACRGVTSG